MSVAFSPDGTRLASGSGDLVGRHGAAVGCGQRQTDHHPRRPYGCGSESVAFSPDGTRLASGSSGMARCGCGTWPAANRPPPSKAIRDCGLSRWRFRRMEPGWRPGPADLHSAAVGCGQRRTDHHPRRPYGLGQWSVAFSPDGTRLASGSWDEHGAAVGCGQRRTDRHPRRPYGCRSGRWRFRRMEPGWRPGPVMARCFCGMWPEAN